MNIEKINEQYYEALKRKKDESQNSFFQIHCPEEGINSQLKPFCLLSRAQLKHVKKINYNELLETKPLSNYSLVTLKMHAGLGTSVKREDIIYEHEGRKTLGAKGTDLFFDYNGEGYSIAELQLLQVLNLSSRNNFKKIYYQNLINKKTKTSVDKLWSKKYVEQFSTDRLLKLDDILQKEMPTLNSSGFETKKHLAPAGHGFIGFLKLLEIFSNKEENVLTSIGNGEDLCSSPDDKIFSWVIENEVPITMITTTKTKDDLKGGQLALVIDDKPYVTIVEKSQAEESNQLDYFEKLGLRDSDNESLFNTNIVVLNHKALKRVFQKYLFELDVDSFIQMITPDLIQNKKSIKGEDFIQLEGALASVLLNLDRYMRKNFNESVVAFLNLEVENRKKFFMPIKKRSDYDSICQKYKVNKDIRLSLKD